MNELRPIIDSDMDSLFVLPLDLIPLGTPALQKAKLIKNIHLQSMVEFFSDNHTGAGHVEVAALPNMFGWPEEDMHPDLAMVHNLSLLPSYDIYSLRLSLRERGIPVNDFAALRLSPEKSAELTSYMMTFTRPLMREIYAGDSVSVDKYEDLVGAFRSPDVRVVRRRLADMAAKLKIDLSELPLFLEDYGDIYLSVSYFRHCLDRLEPYLSACFDSIEDICSHFQLKQNQRLMKGCRAIDDVITSACRQLYGKMEMYDKQVGEIWQDITPEKFHKIRDTIKRDHVAFGTVLCGLTVKMNSFARAFPQASVGGPVKRADFMVTDLMQGLDTIRQSVKAALN